MNIHSKEAAKRPSGDARPPKNRCSQAIFFDAVGTLFYLTKTVGDHYRNRCRRGWPEVERERKLDAAFYSAWKQMPPREAIDGPARKTTIKIGGASWSILS